MEFGWDRAEPLFSKLDWPDHFDSTKWYEMSWSILSEAGLTTVSTPIEDTEVRLRIFTLGWLSHDFGTEMYGRFEPYAVTNPYWEEWISDLDINPLWALTLVTNSVSLKDRFSECEAFSANDYEDIESASDFPDLVKELEVQSVLAASISQRKQIIDVLLKGFGGECLLYANMRSNCDPELRDQAEEECVRDPDHAPGYHWFGRFPVNILGEPPCRMEEDSES